MTDDKALELAQSLHRRTLEDKIEWTEGGSDRAFQASFGNFAVEVREVPDRDYPDQPDYSIAVRDALGREIEQITNVTLRPVMDRTTAEGLNPYAVLQETYRLARRKALGYDKALDSILEQLNKG